MSAEIYRPADNARLDLSSETAVYLPGKNGRQLDIDNTRTRLQKTLTDFRSAEIELLVEETTPAIYFENIVPASGRENDVWQYDENMEPGTVRQIDWATEGADVTVARTVYNAADEVILQEEFVSRYIPWANGYMYGPEVNAPDYSLVPRDK